MTKIYRESTTSLRDLIDGASRDAGATFLIPDLQRPYVWSPTQVILLVDSILRGWPFGTLLLWSVNKDEIETIPSRSFWRIVNRTDEVVSETVSQALAPAAFKMVLDGQQRLQSLLLAFGGDEWGFQLTDREWSEDLGIQRSSVRNARRHWSRGHLFLDLKAFDQSMQEVRDSRQIEFRDVLCWAIGRQVGGQSVTRKPANYRNPLERTFDAENRGRFIRLSRLWDMARPNTTERVYRGELSRLFRDHDAADELVQRVVEPLGEVMTTLSQAKESQVAYLELDAWRPEESRDVYNDAIVNIFTRLNTAGRALTPQEITFAWIKNGWDSARTEGQTAGQCFESLRTEMAQHGFALELDQLVRVVAAVWAVLYNQGELLGSKDLLRGDKVRPMAANLVGFWTALHDDLCVFCRIEEDDGLELGGVHGSLNAVIVLMALWGVLCGWARGRTMSVPVADDFDKRCVRFLRDRADRWLLGSQWAGRWGGSNDQSFARYIKELASLWADIKTISDRETVFERASSTADLWLADLQEDAIRHIQQLEVDQRQMVRAYYQPLWIWHRLDERRWDMSRIPLRIGSRRTPIEQVDHLVPVAIWTQLDTSSSERADLDVNADVINQLGNCSLLEASFNISKNSQPLGDFLRQVHKFNNEPSFLQEWCKGMQITDEFVNPGNYPSADLARAINIRTEIVKSGLISYIKGDAHRVDLTG